MFYKNGKGYTSILRKWEYQLTVEDWFAGKEETLSDRAFKYKDFITTLYNLPENRITDCYFSINQFMCKRETKNLWRLNSIVLDFDFYKIDKYKHLTPKKFYIEVLKDKLEDVPTYVIDSGSGLYVIYCLLEKLPKQCEKYYQATYKVLQQKYSAYGTDAGATLTTQVIRVPGSINSKNGKKVKIIDSSKMKYKLQQFDKYLPYSYESVKKYKMRLPKKKLQKYPPYQVKNKKKYKKNTDVLIEDFKKLIEMRNQNGINTGYRELLLYLLRDRLRFLNYSENESVQIALSMNERFNLPLIQSEVIKTAKPRLRISHIKRLLYYKNYKSQKRSRKN